MSLASILNSLVGTSFGKFDRRSWSWTLVTSGLVTVAGLWLASPGLKAPAPAFQLVDHHSARSVELALNWTTCGSYSYAYRQPGFVEFLMRADRENLRLRSIPLLASGSQAEYCAKVDRPYRNNENSLMLLMAALLQVRSDLTLAELGYAMRAVRALIMVGVVVALLRCGVSLLLTLAVFYASLVIMAAVEATRFYSVYPFLPALLAGFVALVLLFVEGDLHQHAVLGAAGTVLVGWIAAAVVNLRSSYLPILAALTFVWLIVCLIDRHTRLRERFPLLLRSAAVLTSGLLLGFVLFQAVFIRPIDELPATENMSYHVVAHPIVLGLALPPNPLAKDEGIEWNDATGLDLARRVDPQVTEIGPRYEKALVAYYKKLWRDRTKEMANLYWTKLRLAGTDIPDHTEPPITKTFFRFALWPLSLVPHGGIRLLILSMLVLVPLRLTRRWASAPTALVSLTSLTALMLTLETAAILTYFYITHEAAQLLFSVVLGLMAYQAGVNGVFAGARALYKRRRPAQLQGQLSD